MTEPIEEIESKKCAMCDKALAIFGLALGVVFLYISIDLLAGGKVTAMLGGGTVKEESE